MENLVTIDADEYRAAFSSLNKAFDEGRTRPYEWRIHQIRQVLKMIKENEEVLMEAQKLDLGRGKSEARLLELPVVESEIKYMIKNLKKWMYPVRVGTPLLLAISRSEYTYEPLGVALIIGPFNYPIVLTLWPLLGALSAGNCVLIKPSEFSPHIASLLQTLIPKYLDNKCIKVINGDANITSKLLDLPWNKILFTGSARVGKIVAAAAAKHLTPVTLELGGKCPCIIDEYCGDLKTAARRVIWGRMTNCGQTCVAPDYILCHSKHYEEFVRLLVDTVQEFYGPDSQLSNDLSRIVSTAHCDRLQALLDDSGGKIWCGGIVDREKKYVAPTVMTDMRPDSRILSEEIFGPILPVMKITDISEAIRYVKKKEKPLSLSLFTTNKLNINKVRKTIQTGSIIINDSLFQIANVELPFNGVGQSGLGCYRGKFSYEAFSQRMSYLHKDMTPLLDLPVRYPPFTPFKQSVVLFVMNCMSVPVLPNFGEIFRYFTVAFLGAGITIMIMNLKNKK